MPVYNDIQPINETIVTLPQGGYVVPAGWAGNVLPYLQKHGISYQVLAKPAGQVEVQEMRVAQDAVSFDSRTFQGRVRTYITGEWVRTQVNLPKGSLFVPMRQAHALLAAHLFEPVSPDSLSSWGLFNTAYEVTDHIASHRQLQLVQWMYTQDERIRQNYGDSLHRKLPSLRQEYQRRLDRDDRFRDDPEQRMEFWMSQIPYHDPTYHKYPVLRTDRMFTGIKGQ